VIVDPDFLDHWRTGMVADAIGDPMAAIYILRLWAHCQERKSDTFVIPPAGLKAQCKCPAPADVFERALVDAGFLSRDGDTITVLGWAEKNASLIAAWENGAKGGRPKKNPDETHGKPTGNPAVTQREPIANPDETDKRREEKNSSSLRSEEGKRKRSPLTLPNPGDVDEQVWSDWLQLRKDKRATVTETVVASAREEAAKAGMTFEAFLRVWCARGSQGLQADWLKPHERNAGPPPSKQSALEARNAATAAKILENLNAAQRTPEIS
jgi:hypothetical protein